jgi:peptidoglycan/xylan/chitin deacetylase (PgdA/CDA1 family)
MTRIRARQIAGELGYRLGVRRPPVGSLSILMYHAVTDRALDDRGQESIPQALFATHMASLRELGVIVLPLEEGVARLRQGALTGPVVSVVFDDGYVGVHDSALAALIQYQIPATIFLATAWMGGAGFPWASSALGRPLSWSEVATLVTEARCSIGSHTHTHPVLSRLAPAAVQDELRRSSEAIQDHAGVTPRIFAYPYGSYGTFNGRTRALLADAGFVVACTTVWGRYHPDDDPLAVKRIRLSWCDSVHELRKAMAGCYDWYRIVQRFQAFAAPIS